MSDQLSESSLQGENEVPGEWTFMVDPAWQPVDKDDEPPFEAVVGGWFIREDGEISLFRPNSRYEPSQPGLPTDPVDAVLQLLVSGEGDGDELLLALQDILLGVAIDEEGMALIAPAPDDLPSVLVATAPQHRAKVNAAGWREVTLVELADALPPEGVDLLLNPGAPASMRLEAKAVWRHFAEASAEPSDS